MQLIPCLFATMYHSICETKLGHCGLDGWTTTWVKMWCNDEAQRKAVKGSYPSLK